MIDTAALTKTLHKGQSISADKDEADLYIYKDYGDGTGILTDGLNTYFCYNDFKSVGDICPQDARLVDEVETIILKEFKTVIEEVKEYKSTNPLATKTEIYEQFKTKIKEVKSVEKI